MRIHVKLFAILRERAGVDETSLDLPADATVTQASAELSTRFPALREHLGAVGYAINRSYVKPNASLHDGDELALIPPVSGG